MTNTLKLRALMLEKGFTQGQLAKTLGISEQAMNQKINNKREFKASEIATLLEVLSVENIGEVFFNPEVS
ncbi:MAG: helix-turn-helix domain-containing protein [Eubacteriales bacterium]|nr:helix-turn-helix domain-containing protein [Eubacteriales bacterium]